MISTKQLAEDKEKSVQINQSTYRNMLTEPDSVDFHKLAKIRKDKSKQTIEKIFKLHEPIKKYLKTKKHVQTQISPSSALLTPLKKKFQHESTITQLQSKYQHMKKFNFEQARIKRYFEMNPIENHSSMYSPYRKITYFQRDANRNTKNYTQSKKAHDVTLPNIDTKENPYLSKYIKRKDQISKVKIVLSQKIRQKFLKDINDHNYQKMSEDINLKSLNNSYLWIDKFQDVKQELLKQQHARQHSYKRQFNSKQYSPYRQYLTMTRAQQNIVKNNFFKAQQKQKE